ncbi:hypothetical protein Trydic_g7664 [Trypoxylus dichotomus]
MNTFWGNERFDVDNKMKTTEVRGTIRGRTLRDGSREGEDDPALTDGSEDRAEDRHPGHGENDNSNQHGHDPEDWIFKAVGEGTAPSPETRRSHRRHSHAAGRPAACE